MASSEELLRRVVKLFSPNIDSFREQDQEDLLEEIKKHLGEDNKTLVKQDETSESHIN